MVPLLFQKSKKWSELDVKLMKMTEDVDYDVEGKTGLLKCIRRQMLSIYFFVIMTVYYEPNIFILFPCNYRLC